jgi:hypothetical protein
MEMLKRAWAGQEKLWKVWWLIGVPLWIAVNLLLAWIGSVTHLDTFAPPDVPYEFLFCVIGASCVAWFAWLVTVWRCAGRRQ